MKVGTNTKGVQMDNEARYKLWERQPWDSDLTWQIFHQWLMSDDRDLDKVWRNHVNKTYTPTGSLIVAPSYIRKAYDGMTDVQIAHDQIISWSERARAFDNAQDNLDLEMAQQRKRRIRREEWSMAMLLLDKAKEMIKWPIYVEEIAEEDDDGNTITLIRMPMKWSLRDVQGLAKTASELARLSTDMVQGRYALDLNITLSRAAVDALNFLEDNGVPQSSLVAEFERILVEAAHELQHAEPREETD